MEIFLFLLTCFGGSLIQTVSGFGFGIFALSFFPYFMPGSTMSVAIAAMVSLSNCLIIVLRTYKHVQPRVILPSILGYFITSAVVITLLAGKSDDLIKRILAVALICMSIYFFFFSQRVRVRPTLRNGIIAGALGGILGGMFGMGGPPMVVYLSSVYDDKEHYLANIQCYFVVTNLYSTAVRAINGIVTLEVIQYWLIGTVAAYVGILLGRRLLPKIRVDVLKKIIYGFMAASGVLMLL